MTDRPARDTDPAPAPGEQPIGELVLAEIRAVGAHVADLRGLVLALAEDVKAARHAAALAADEALAQRTAAARTADRLDLIDADGCGRYRAHVRAGNGSG